ncbi:hypothetical protein [Saccharopolyspora spinosa]|uniref:hypothetical protein n=1 Tax=Saccharopolyspora spinosa TaxID=60894 RepID=UPI000302984E|nr:hypothetical protein [Saccharopolyspora spinosa]
MTAVASRPESDQEAHAAGIETVHHLANLPRYPKLPKPDRSTLRTPWPRRMSRWR